MVTTCEPRGALERAEQRLYAQLAELRGAGIALFRGWQSYEVRSQNRIVSRVQTACRPERLMIPGANAADWIIHNINVGRNAQLVQPIAGDIFAADTPNPIGLSLEPIAAGVDVTAVVEYVGSNPDGEVFRGTLACRASPPLSGQNPMATRSMIMLPLTSNGPIKPGLDANEFEGLRILIGLDDTTWQFEERGGRLHAVSQVDAPIYHRPTGVDGDLRTMQASAGGYDLEGTLESQRRRNVVTSDAVSQVIRKPSGWSGFTPEEFRDPIVVSLHIARLPRLALFGVDDATDRVVFEVGNTAPQGNRHFAAKYVLDGYEPWWWPELQAWESDLLEAAP